MSRFRKKAEDVYAQGALERGEFQPTGAPLKVYQYWHSRTKNAPANENFCHFWRVVAFWAPLMKIRSGLSRMAEKPLTWLFVFLAYAAGMIALGVFVSWFIPTIVLFTPMLAVGLALGEEASKRNKSLGDIEGGMKIPFWVTAPASLPSYYGNRYAKNVSDREAEVWAWIGLGTFALLLLTLIGGLITAGAMDIGWAVLYYVFGIPLGLAALVLGLGFIGSGIESVLSKRRAKRKAKKDAHNAKVREQYDAYLRGDSEFNPFAIKKHVPGPREQKIIDFFKGAGEFLSLAWNIVRVNKWKICPIVKIESETVTK
jgi:MFS family permease